MAEAQRPGDGFVWLGGHSEYQEAPEVISQGAHCGSATPSSFNDEKSFALN